MLQRCSIPRRKPSKIENQGLSFLRSRARCANKRIVKNVNNYNNGNSNIFIYNTNNNIFINNKYCLVSLPPRATCFVNAAVPIILLIVVAVPVYVIFSTWRVRSSRVYTLRARKQQNHKNRHGIPHNFPTSNSSCTHIAHSVKGLYKPPYVLSNFLQCTRCILKMRQIFERCVGACCYRSMLPPPDTLHICTIK